MNEWASPWESHPPTPETGVVVKDTPPPQDSTHPPIAPKYGFFDAFANEASWGNDEEPAFQPSKTDSVGRSEEQGGGGFGPDLTLEQWRVPQQDSRANGLDDETDKGFKTTRGPAGDRRESDAKGIPSNASILGRNDGLLDMDDGFFGNAPDSSNTGYVPSDHTQNHDLLDMMDDDFFGSGPIPLTTPAPTAQDLVPHESGTGDNLAPHVRNEGNELANGVDDLKWDNDIATSVAQCNDEDGEIKLPDGLSHKVEGNELSSEMDDLTWDNNTAASAVQLEDEHTKIVLHEELEAEPNSPDPVPSLGAPEKSKIDIPDDYAPAASEETSPGVKNETSLQTEEPRVEDEPSNSRQDNTTVEIAESSRLGNMIIEEQQEDAKTYEESSSTKEFTGFKLPKANELHDDLDGVSVAENAEDDQKVDDPEHTEQSIRGDTILDFPAIDDHQAVESGSSFEMQGTLDEDNSFFEIEDRNIQPQENEEFVGANSMIESPAIPVTVELPQSFDTAPIAVTPNDYGDFGEFEESLGPDVTSSDDQKLEALPTMVANDTRNIAEDVAFTHIELDDAVAGRSGSDAVAISVDESAIDPTDETFPSFQIDKSVILKLFPQESPTSSKPPPEPNDEQIDSTSVRKTWYRISRQSSMRYYNSSDFDNYIRVTWPGSAVQAKVTDIVTKWVAADRQSGGSIFKPTFKPKKPSGTLPEHPSANTEPASTFGPVPGMKITIPKPPRSPTGFGWSSVGGSISAIPAPPSSSGLLTPRVSTPSGNLQVPDPMRLPTPTLVAPPQPPPAPVENEAEDDDEFGIFVSSASPLGTQPVDNHVDNDFGDWFDSTTAGVDVECSPVMATAINKVPIAMDLTSDLLQRPPAPAPLNAENPNDFGDWFAQPLASQQPLSTSPNEPLSSPIPGAENTVDRASTPLSQRPAFKLESEVTPSSAKDVDVTGGWESPRSSISIPIAAPQTNKLSVTPDWFNTTLVPSKPQTPVSANRSSSPAPASFAGEDWFDAPSTSQSPLPAWSMKPLPSTADQNLNIDDSFDAAFASQHPSATSPPPPPAIEQSYQGLGDWLDDAFAAPKENANAKNKRETQPTSFSHPTSPYNSSPFLPPPPPPRPHSAIPGPISSRPKAISTANVSSPLAQHSSIWNSKDNVEQADTGADDDFDDDFDDEFGGFVSPPPPPSAVQPHSNLASDSGWHGNGDARTNQTSFVPIQPSTLPWALSNSVMQAASARAPTPVSLSTSASAPAQASPFGDLGSAFDAAFLDPPAASKTMLSVPPTNLPHRSAPVTISAPPTLSSKAAPAVSDDFAWAEDSPDKDGIDHEFVSEVVKRLPDWSWIL